MFRIWQNDAASFPMRRKWQKSAVINDGTLEGRRAWYGIEKKSLILRMCDGCFLSGASACRANFAQPACWHWPVVLLDPTLFVHNRQGLIVMYLTHNHQA